MDDKDDAKSFIRKFGKFDDSYWIQGNRLNKGNSSRSVMHNKWVCSFSSHRKVENSKKNQKCDAFIDFLIKIVTKGSKKNDVYLKRDPPLNTVIKINPFHSHNCGSADALKRLFIDPEVKSVFLKYFVDGLSPSQAMKQNISRLCTLPNYIVSLANGALHPRPWTVYRLRHKYLEENYGSFKEPFERLEEKIPDYLNQGIHVVMDKTDPWVVLVVTPLNERAQKLKNSSEIIFMDSTSSCDVSMASITVFLTATKSGAVTIGVLLHKQQTAMAYEKGFKMLIDNFTLCFNGLTAVYAKNHEDFQDVINEINHLEGNQLFKDRFNENLKRSQEWSMSYRNENLITHFAYNRRNQKDYELQLTKMKSVDPNSILQIDEFLYKVPSSKESKKTYDDPNEWPTPQTSIMEKENLKTTRETTNLQLCSNDFSNNLQDGDIENDPNIRLSISQNNNQSLNDKFT
ncbi:hypothetical protein ACI65C_005698 [Semiaphis heraclei]